MKKSLFISLFVCLLLWLPTISVAGEPTPLKGQWKGLLKVPGGSLELIITIMPLTNGSYYAALDVPKQRVNRMPVEVELKGNDLTLRMEQAGSSFVGKVAQGGATLTGTWKQPGLTAPLVLKRLVVSTPPVAKKARLTPPYREEDVTFMNTGAKLKLAGTLTIPAGPGPFPAVALLSDTGPQDRDAGQQEYRMFGQLADYLTRRGIAVLRFDDRGVGKSGGDYRTATTVDLVGDAQAALTFLRSRELIDPQHVGLLGHGEGANVALLAAADQHTKTPDFVVSLAGYGLTGRDVLLRQQVEIMRLIGSDAQQVQAAVDLHNRMVEVIRQTPDDTQARAKLAGILRLNNTHIDPVMAKARAIQLTTPWSRYFMDFDPTHKLSDVKCPVLALNGVDDLQVAARTNLSMLSKGLNANRDVTVHKLAGVNHSFQPDVKDWPIVNGQQQPAFSPKALDTIREWVMERSGQPDGKKLAAHTAFFNRLKPNFSKQPKSQASR
ncbi:alpha/beta hydrolase [Hymenobacter sp. BT188]|uniref:alpha/beta hydrolase family protein n=1 Tax=Hymenobacter sp. BT188 TaxID=2763504 RepID=UPI0016519ECA|nr:alpha/beta fold hydrolase [Hymenobacter sp. BT188]MBC6608492.1 alpha/beta hydrolase [Hymenobacter sp. BT188]